MTLINLDEVSESPSSISNATKYEFSMTNLFFISNC